MVEPIVELAKKVERVERSNRRLRGAVLALGLAWCLVPLMGQAAPDDVADVIHAKSLQIVDADGTPRVTLDAEGVRTWNENGMLGVHVGDDSGPTVTVFDPYDGTSPVVTVDSNGIRYNESGSTTAVVLGGDDERAGLYITQGRSLRAQFVVGDDRRARLELREPESSVMIQGGSPDGGVTVYEQGVKRLSLGPDIDGSYGVFGFDDEENPMMALASNDAGLNFLELRAEAGQQAVFVSTQWDPPQPDPTITRRPPVPFEAALSIFKTRGTEVPAAVEIVKLPDDSSQILVNDTAENEVQVYSP